jgi:hypothetical protein
MKANIKHKKARNKEKNFLINPVISPVFRKNYNFDLIAKGRRQLLCVISQRNTSIYEELQINQHSPLDITKTKPQ